MLKRKFPCPYLGTLSCKQNWWIQGKCYHMPSMFPAAHLGGQIWSQSNGLSRVKWTLGLSRVNYACPKSKHSAGGEKEKEERRKHASNTLCCMCFLFPSLACVTAIVIRCLRFLKKGKKGEGKKMDPAMFFPSLLEMSSELPGRGMQAIPWSWGNDVGATLHGADMGERQRRGSGFRFGGICVSQIGPPIQLEPGTSVPLSSSPINLMRERQRSYQLSASLLQLISLLIIIINHQQAV